MATAPFQKAGFPDVASTRKAIIEPELLNLPSGAAGMTVAKMDPGGRVIKDPAIPHTTYNTQLGGQYVGGFDRPIPRGVMFPDWMATRPPGEPGPMNDYSFERQTVAQPANQQWLDNIMRYIQGGPGR
jgi:hypothetical protein